MEATIRKGRGWDIILLVIAIIAMLWVASAMSGCVTQEKCWKKYPPQENTYESQNEVSKDTSKKLAADTSGARYLIECQKTADGYRARIIQLLGQNQGRELQTPVSVMRDTTLPNGSVLTTTALLPEREIHWQIKSFYYKAVKSLVCVRITNVLTGWQWFQVWSGRILWGLLLIAGAYFALKRYTGLMI